LRREFITKLHEVKLFRASSLAKCFSAVLAKAHQAITLLKTDEEWEEIPVLDRQLTGFSDNTRNI